MPEIVTFLRTRLVSNQNTPEKILLFSVGERLDREKTFTHFTLHCCRIRTALTRERFVALGLPT